MAWTEETYRIHELDPENISLQSPELIDESVKCYDPEDRPVILAAFRGCVKQGTPYDMEFPFTTARGRRLHVRTAARPVMRGDRVVKVIGHIIDITGRKESEERIRALLAEKELLLREVHHRLKNNLSTIVSLLELQAGEAREPAVADALNETKVRLRGMIKLYEKLYTGNRYDTLSIGEYLPALADEITGSFPRRDDIIIEKRVEDFLLDVKTVFPLGIIVYELITNAMKYAFPGGEGGLISIAASSENGRAKITIGDNGVGLPGSVDIERSSGFGLQLVGQLVKQIGGSIRIERDGGTRFVMEFGEREIKQAPADSG